MSVGDQSIAEAASASRAGPDLRGAAVQQLLAGADGDLLALLQGWDRHDARAVERAAGVAEQAYLDAVAALVQRAAPQLHHVARELAPLLAYMTPSRCLYLVRYIAQYNTQFLDSLALLIETDGDRDPALAALRRRFEAFPKARLLGEIFSGKRLHRIHTIMESYTDE